jgi:hypothetical protein
MNVKIYKCFIGSPGDTTEERKYCKEVFSTINKTIGEKFNFRVESLMWEDDCRPAFGDDGQEVINRQLLLKEYRIFIGIMWSRFGAPTKRAESGTVEEFEDAYKKYKENKDLEICMYFNKQDIPQSNMDIEQISKVFQFKTRVSELGGLYKEYRGAEQFKEYLRDHLTKYFLEKYEVNHKSIENEDGNENSKEIITNYLTERLNSSLSFFNGQKPCWIDPVLSSTNLISSNYNENFESRVNLFDIIENPKSIIIKSPPQFGLTCLSHFFVLNAWKRKDIWIYLNAEKLNINAIEKSVTKELKTIFNTENISNIKCIILDSWQNCMHGGMKMLKNISNIYNDIPIIVMQTIDENNFLQEPASENIEREFQVLHLLSLPKTEIRKMVSSYNSDIYIDEEDKVVNKIVLDLDTLNIHRTPMNCLTLLKVSEKYFDEKTINRTDMLDKVLYILFDFKNLPTYQSNPDVKDCEFVLGIFCEEMLKTEKYYFTKKDFVKFSEKVCEDNYIQLDINSLFDILFINGIIIERFSEFTFRATYWMFYFAAHRMHANQEFCNFIFESGKYVNYPEIIEFYTGIDRRRTDALEILNKDLSQTCEEVLTKIGLPEHIDPYLKVEWNPTEASIEQARSEISDNVQLSKLPTQIKDQHSDAMQNQLRPYNQGISTILHEYSLAILMRKIVASSRALRNSDYANAGVKKDLLNSIIGSYEQVAKALMVLTPELAINGHAAFGGQSFNLDGDFGDTIVKRINMVLQSIPGNIVKFFKEDIDSDKLGPLLIEKANEEKIPLNKHVIMLLMCQIRPLGWRKTIETYINKLPKNSFYLFDLMGHIRFLYFYDYTTDSELSEIKHLIQLGYSKHEFGKNKPSKSVLTKFTHSLLKKPESEIN